MNLKHVLVASLALLVIPLATNAAMVYPEGEPQYFPVGEVLGVNDGLSAEEQHRQMLIQLIQILRMQLQALLEKQAVALPGEGQSKSFNTGEVLIENDDLRFRITQKEVGPFIFDGTDYEDDSWYFAMTMEISNKSHDQSLIVDRSSLVIDLVNQNKLSVSPKRKFNFKTGFENTTADYGYDNNNRKLLVIKPGQTAKALVYHPYQVSARGNYRGYLEKISYTHDSVTYDDDTDLFMSGKRAYELDEDSLKHQSIDEGTLMVETKYIDHQISDNKYNLKTFNESEFPFTFSYPEEFAVVESGDTWTISYEGNPYFVVSTDSNADLPDLGAETKREVSALNAERMEEVMWLYNEGGLSGTVSLYTPIPEKDYSIVVYEYADTSEMFTRYNVKEVFLETFVSR